MAAAISRLERACDGAARDGINPECDQMSDWAEQRGARILNDKPEFHSGRDAAPMDSRRDIVADAGASASSRHPAAVAEIRARKTEDGSRVKPRIVLQKMTVSRTDRTQKAAEQVFK